MATGADLATSWLQPFNEAIAWKNDPANARFFAKTTGGALGAPTTYGDSLVQPMGVGGGYQAKASPFGGAPSADAQAYAKYMTNLSAGQSNANALAKWLADGAKIGDANTLYEDILKNGTAKYAPYYEGYAEWLPREQQRANASGMLSGTLGSLIPTVMGAVTGNPWLGAAVGATQQGIASGGNLLSMIGGAAGGYGGAKAVPQAKSAFQNVLGKIKGVTTPNPLAGNAVPGIRTGVTTPAGGAAITGSGKAAVMTGLQGGAPLGASPLAVAGGAVPSNIFPNFPQLGQVQPLPSGRIPGTNINVGSKDPTGPLTTTTDNIMKALGNIPTGGGVQTPGAVFSDPVQMATSNNGTQALGAALASGSGSATGASPSFYNELSRLLGDQPGIGHKTRPGAYFNALAGIQPSGSSYA